MKTWPEKNLMMMTGEVKKLQLPLHHGHETVCYNGVHTQWPQIGAIRKTYYFTLANLRISRSNNRQ